LLPDIRRAEAMSRGYPKAAGNASAPEDGTQERFQTTQWSVVLVAGGTPSPGAETALADLLRTYWHPLYAYVRSRGYSPEDSQDLIQGFYERLLEGHRLGYADPKRGRFRTFLLTCLNHFLANEKTPGKRSIAVAGFGSCP
jgi:RNA polymerase sigma-70 factor (ECF subfamily)